MNGTLRDVQRSKVYAAEHNLHWLLDKGGMIELAGTLVTLPPEAKFGSIQSVQTYVDTVLQMTAIRDAYPRSTRPVTVRERRGDAKAHYELDTERIALPTSSAGQSLRREMVVLHELVHHLVGPAVAGHGPEFAAAMVDVIAAVMGPEMGFVTRVIFDQNGVAVR